MKKTLLAIALTTSMGAAQAATTFDMWDPADGYMNTDATVTGSVDEVAGTWAVSSTTPFSGLIWTATGGTLYGAGTHTISTVDDTCPQAVCASGPDITFTVGAGQLGGSIKFAWGATGGIDVVNVWDTTGGGYSAVMSTPMVDGPFPMFQATFHIDDLSRVGVQPAKVSAVPVPAAVWLFGSGLLGLVGVARRKKAA